MQAQTLPVGALPGGLTMAAGQAQVAVNGNRMTVVNTPQAILNWNSFNIGANASVSFQQASAASSVLNRVTGADPSAILGSLSSNGRVWLLNPNGVIFGAGARVDVAGLVTSTLRLNDSDWLAGRYSFSAGNPEAAVLNQGELHSSFGGTIALLGDSVRNEGAIQADGGQIILAAGKSIELVDTGAPNLGVRITADAGAARNLGTLQAAGGRIDIHAAAVNQSGIVSADGFGTGPGGEIWIKASGTAELTAGSRTTASSAAAAGGSVVLLGQNVGLLGNAQVQADGTTGGGSVMVGGGERGQDARYANATAVFFGPAARISADATASGDGGRIVLWSDAATRAYGSLSARGGLLGGDGGFIETSGGWLDARPAKVDTYAPRGASGVWLLDPFDLTLSDNSNELNIDPSTPGTYSATGTPAQLSSNTVQTALNSGTSVIVSTGPSIQGQAGQGGPGVITVDGANIHANSTATGTGASLTLSAATGITVNSSFISLGGVRSTGNITLYVQDGPIAISNSTLQTSAAGGQVNLGGGALANSPSGELYTGASSSVAFTPAVSISNSTILGGNFGGVTIGGISRAGTGAGVLIQGGSTLISGGALAISGFAQNDTALDLESGSNLQAFGSFSLRGTSVNGTGSTAGVLISGASINSPQLQSSTNLIRGQTASGSGRGVSTTAATIDSASALVIEGSSVFGGSTDAAVSLNGGIATAQGDLTLRTFGSGQRVEVTGTTVSANGNITLQAADTVFLNGGSAVNATGKLSVLAQNQSHTGFSTLGAGSGSEIFFGGASGGPVTSFFSDAGLNFFSSTRWIVFATDPAASGFQPGSNLRLATAFTRYGATTATDWAGDVGNGFVFSAQKTASYTASVTPRAYDGTLGASITGSAVGSVAGDTGTAIAGSTVTYLNANAGTGKTATFSVAEPFSIHGSDGKPVYGYTLSGAPLTGTVTQASLSMEGTSVPSRVYDGTTVATVITGPLSGLIGSETLGVTVNAAFANKNASLTPKAVTANYTLTDGLNGGKAANYQLTASPALTGIITLRSITPTGLSAQNKTYDGTTVATISGTPVLAPLPGDSLSLLGSATGVFADKNAGTGKSITVGGLSLNPASLDFGNYQLGSPSLSANIGKLALTVTGLVADNKIYDRTLSATISGTPTVSSPVTSDEVGVTGSASGAFVNFNQGSGKTVTVNGSGLSLSGLDSGNYTLQVPPTLLATILPRPISWTGLSVADKVYDGTTTASVLGTATVTPLSGDTLAVNGTPTTGFPLKDAAIYSLSIAGLSLGGASASNYTLTPPSAGVSATISRRPIAITGFANSKVYDGTPVTSTFNLQIAPLAGDELLLFGTSSAVALFADPNVGAAKPATLFGVTVGGASVGNYIIGGSTFQADITKRPITLSGLVANSKTYDASTLATITGTPILSNVVAGDPLTAAGAATGAFADKNVGTAKIVTVSGLSPGGPTGANYSFAPLVLSANIDQASTGLTGLTVTPKVYDGTTTATLSGTAAAATFGSDVVTVTGTPSGVFNSKDVLSASSVTITGLSVAGPDAPNYKVNVSSVPATISPRPLNATGLSVASKVYDGTVTASGFAGIPVIAPLAGDDVQLGFIPATPTNARFADKNVGTNKALLIDNVALTGTAASNYVLGFASTASITALAIPVTLGTALNKVYDGTTAAQYSSTATATPLSGDSITIGGTAVGTFASKNVGTGISVSYSGGLVAAGPDGQNYTLTSSAPPQTANISRSPLAMGGLTAASKVYDGSTLATLVGTPAPAVFAGDKVTVLGSAAAAFSDRNAATGKTVAVTGLSISGPDAGNYVLGAIALTADIAPLARSPGGLTVASKVYDASTSAVVSGSATFTAVAGDNIVVSGSPAASFLDKQVGTGKSVIYSGLSLSGPAAANYVLLTTAPSTAAISALPLGVDGLAAVSKVYDSGLAATLTGTAVISPLAGDSLALVGNATGSFGDKNVGTQKTVVVAGMGLGGPDAGNYTLTAPILKADITPLTLTATGLQAANKLYDGTRSAPLTGVPQVATLAGDSVSLSGSAQGVFLDKNVGNAKPIAVEGLALAGADGANYRLSTTTLSANITPNVLSVSGLIAASKVYDGNTNATITGRASVAAVPGDELRLAGAASGQFTDRNVGTAKDVQLSGLVLEGADSANYRLNPLPVLKGSITPRGLAVVGVRANARVYDGTTLATLSGNGTVVPIAGDAVALGGTVSATFIDKNAGTSKPVTVAGYTLAGADAGNYTLAQPQGLAADITPLAVKATGLQTADKVYDGTVSAPLSGVAQVRGLAGDTLGLGGTAQGLFADKNVGSGRTVTVAGLALAGADAGNYSLTATALTASVTPKVVTVSGLAAANKVYDGNAKATLSGSPMAAVVPGDDISLAGTLSALFSDRNVGVGKDVQVSGLALTGSDAANYRLDGLPALKADITPRSLTVVGLGASGKIYDGTATAPLTGTGSIAPVAGDAVALAGTARGRFDDKSVGTAKTVTVLGYELAGADAGNYTLTLPQGLRADITPLGLAVTGLQANSKVYDGSADASLSGLALVSTLADDSIALQGTPAARFADANVGSAKPVTVGGYVLSGPDAANYRLVQPQGLSATIATAPLQYESTIESRTVGEPLGTLGGHVTGFVAGETLATATTGTAVFRASVSDTSTPGIYAVLGSGLVARNYSFTQAAGNAQALTVNAPLITLQDLQTAAANPSATPRDPTSTVLLSTASIGALTTRSDNTGVVDTAALAQTLTAVADKPGSVLAAGAGSFGAVKLASMSAGEVSAMLGRRSQYTQNLFAEASNKLKANPALADLKPCVGLDDASSGKCAITPELKARIAAQGGLSAMVDAPAPAATAAAIPVVSNAATSVVAPTEAARAAATAAAARRARASSTTAPTLAELQRNKRSIKTAALPQIERKIALVIGVGSYDDEAIPQLANAVGDARAVARVLESQLGYEPVVLENATKATLVAALNRLALTVGPRDSVMVYYAGHGELVETTQLGYWLLSDSESKSPETWLSNSDISRLVAQIGASQVALISDSCYSGSLVSEERIRALPQGLDPQVVLGRKSVVVMSSGGNQPVFDDGRDGHSPFAWHFMNTINQMANWQAGGNIFERVRFAVARALPQRPQYSASTAAGHVPGGDYLFEQRRLNLPTP